MIKTMWQQVLEILFPSICLNCRSYLQSREERENLLCSNCFDGIKIYSNVFRPDPRTNLIAVGSYENAALRELIHSFKYNGFLGARVPLEKLVIKWLSANRELASRVLDSGFLLVPIPLHKNRLRARGFNQAEIITLILSQLFRLPMARDLLSRTRDTRSQIEMKNKEERRDNIKNSIAVRENKESVLLQYQNVILVDDVYTSGSTMEEAMRALRRSGAKDITAFVIAKT
ncbi:MAG: ComF family protein [Candidatus Colwellbacteria bacterium]